MVPVVLAQFEVSHRNSLENRMSEQIYPVSGTVNKFPWSKSRGDRTELIARWGGRGSRLLSLNDCQFCHWPPSCALCCRGNPKPRRVISESPHHLWLSEVTVLFLRQGKMRAAVLCLLQQWGWCAAAAVSLETWWQCREKTWGFQRESESSVGRAHACLWGRQYHPGLKKWDCQILCCLHRWLVVLGIRWREMILCNQQSTEDAFMKSYESYWYDR